MSAVRAGAPWIVGVEGQAGIGKTTLVRHLVDGLHDFDVLWVSCDPAEQDYAFGVIDQLARRLPRQLLADSKIMAKGVAPNTAPVEVGADLVRILAAAQEAQPLLLAIDDVEWSDGPSAAVLGFVARRLWTERILVLLTMRTESSAVNGATSPEGAPGWQRMVASSEHSLRIPLGGMDETEILEFAQAVCGGVLSHATAVRLLDHTGGHPLYLRSLLTGTSADDLADPHHPLPAPEPLATALSHTMESLTPDSRSLVEALAVLGTTTPLPLAARVAGVADPAAALRPALDSGIVQWWPSEPASPVGIKHALQQDAIYKTISPSRRQALHGAAASMVSRSASWAHRVAAADRLDASLAAELEAEAERLAVSSQLSRAATLLLWAADLSETREARDRRLLTGVIRLLLARDYSRGRDLLDAVAACGNSAARTCVLGALAYARGDLKEAEQRLSEAIDAADTEGSARIATLACVWLGATYSRQHRGDKALPLLLRAVGLDLPEPRAVNYARHLLALASGSIARSTEGPAAADGSGEAAETIAQADLAASVLLNPRGILREMAAELHAGMEDFRTLMRRHRVGETGEVEVSEYFMLAAFQYLAGAWDDADVTAKNSLTLAAAGGQLFGFAAGHAIAAMAAATQGRLEVADEQLRASERAARHTGLPLDAVYPVLAGVIIGQARGDPAAMGEALRRLAPPDNDSRGASWQGWWLPLQVEACIGAGRLDEAADALGRLEALSEDVPNLKVAASWLAGELSEARGESDSALAAYLRGLARPDGADDIPLYRARLEHAYGRMLLPTDPPTALDHLRKARNRYLAIGALPFAERVAEETAEPASSHPEEPPAAGVLAPLTERERAVARLAVDGMTNKEIAEKLYVSAKTVEYHLGHVFTKLGLSSRRQLRALLTKHQPPSGGTSTG